MNTHLEGWLVSERLEEARAFSAREALLRSLRPERQPVRVVLGLSLIRIGRWLAGRARRAAGEPKRAMA